MFTGLHRVLRLALFIIKRSSINIYNIINIDYAQIGQHNNTLLLFSSHHCCTLTLNKCGSILHSKCCVWCVVFTRGMNHRLVLLLEF